MGHLCGPKAIRIIRIIITCLCILQRGSEAHNSSALLPEEEFNSTSGGGHFVYFAYGSNLLRERIHMNNPTAVFHGTARLQDRLLRFGLSERVPLRHNRWHGGVATIEEQVGAEVWGVVWRVGLEHLHTLDKQEGVQRGLYRPLVVTVETADGELTCRTYEMNHFTERLPSPQYKKVVCLGAEQNGLPLHYLQKLYVIETNNYTGPSLLDDIKIKMKQNNVFNFANLTLQPST